MSEPRNEPTRDVDNEPGTDTPSHTDDAAKADETTANPATDSDPRTRILAATAALLGEIGWGQITTRKVAQRADVNNALIHYYFGTKSKLLVETATQVMLQQFGEPLALLADPETAVADAMAASVEWLGRSDLDPVQLRALSEITVNGLREPALAGLSRAMLADGRKSLADRLTSDGLDGSRAEASATIMFALLDGLLLHLIIDPELRFDGIPTVLAALFRKESL